MKFIKGDHVYTSESGVYRIRKSNVMKFTAWIIKTGESVEKQDFGSPRSYRSLKAAKNACEYQSVSAKP